MTTTEKIAAVHDHLIAAVEALTTGHDWRRFLEVAQRFHAYSTNNLLLILAQRPDATRVAGYRTWQSVGRQVRRGERGIAILAPCTYRTMPDSDAESADDDGDRPQPVLRGFRVVHVFDVTQTDGEPLPSVAPIALDGDAPVSLLERLITRVRAAGFAYHRAALPWPFTRAYGLTDFAARRVTVRDDLAPAQAVKTTAHELAHVLLHGPDRPPVGRDREEVEAESVAFVVSGAWGLDTGSYTFPYLARWAKGDVELVRATAERVTSCARRILEDLIATPAASAP